MLWGTLFEAHEYSRKIPVPPFTLTPIRLFHRFQNYWRLSALGQFTDDTEMAMVLLRHLISNQMTYDPKLVVIEYMRWVNTRITFLGKNYRTYSAEKMIPYEVISTRYVKRFPNHEVSRVLNQMAP